MQIQLVQTEIEQALRNYINGLINIKEGTQINIDLSAGRGADGFKATIDIVALADQAQTAVKAETKPAEKEKAKSEPVEEKQASKAADTKAAQTQASADAKPETQTNTGAATGSATDAGNAEAAQPETAATETAKAEPVQAEAASEAQATDGEQAAQPRKSLFGGLTKPTNE